MQLVKAFAYSACAYGSELLGMCAVNSQGVHGKLTALIQSAYKFGLNQRYVASGVLSTDSEVIPIRAIWQINRVRVLRKHLQMTDTVLGQLLHANKQSAYSFKRSTETMLRKVIRHFNVPESIESVPLRLVGEYYTHIWRKNMETRGRQEALIGSGCLRPTWPTATWYNVLAQVPMGNPLTVEKAFLRMRHGQFMSAARMRSKDLISSEAVPCPLCGGQQEETVPHYLRRCI